MGSLINTSSFWVQRLCFGWLSWELSYSEFWVGLIAFLLFFPIVIFGPLFGVMTDRVNRQRAAIIVLLISALLTISVALCQLFNLLNITSLCLFAAATGMVTSAYSPLRMAMIASLVQRHELPSAVATGAIIFNISRLTGPALAGIIISLYGVGSALIVGALMIIPMIIILHRITFNLPTFTAVKQNGLHSLIDGVVYVSQNSRLISFLILSAVISLFGRGVLELFPAFADGVFKQGSSGLAILTAAAGIGAICAGLVLSNFSSEKLIHISLASLGLLVGWFGVTDNFIVAVLLIMLIGFCITICGVGTQTMVQMLVSDDYRGRVMSIWGVMGFGGTALGGLLIGLLAIWIGLPYATLVSGVTCTVVTVLFFYFRQHTTTK